MERITIPFSETHRFPAIVDDFLDNKKQLQPFYKYRPESESFKDAIAARKNFKIDRELLVKVLEEQYSGLDLSDSHPVVDSIKLLRNENTFTITTGHQLCIYTGPLYSVYKIITVIKLARELKSQYPGFDFVPVFWMAGEDHDFEEVNHLKVFGKKIKWDTNQSGPVGRMSTEGMEKVVNEIRELTGAGNDLLEFMHRSYLESETLTEATRKIVNRLFGDYGLVAIDADNAELKQKFTPVMISELKNSVSGKAMEVTNTAFSKNYKIQVTPREVNLFYLEDGLRERIVSEDNKTFSVNNTEKEFTISQLEALVKSNPEKFSPNVVLRPVYQETILPNLAYIGGPGELNYWFQLTGVFESFNTPYPILILRNCMLWVDKYSREKLEKLQLDIRDIFHSADELILKVLENSAEYHPSTDKQSAVVQKVYNDLVSEFEKLDPSLKQAIEGEKQKVLNGLKNIEDKGRRALKRKNETTLNQVKSLKEKLFPEGALQERTENFISLMLKSEVDFLNTLFDQTEPFCKEFIILSE